MISSIVVSLPDAHRVVGEVYIAVVAFSGVSYQKYYCLGAFPRNIKGTQKNLQKSERRLVRDEIAGGGTYISAS
jgi:hypothetical protein